MHAFNNRSFSEKTFHCFKFIMIKKCIIIFSGFNQRAVIAFIRTLELHNIDFAIVAMSADDTILMTTYRSKVIVVRNSVPLLNDDIINSIKAVKDKIPAKEYIIAPSTEALNRFLLKNKTLIESQGVLIPLINESLYSMISDKYSFMEVCVKHGIQAPKKYSECKDAKLPFVAKPMKYFAPSGNIYSPFIIWNEEDRKIFMNNHENSDFFFQEYVSGRSFYLLYYFHRNGLVFKYSQENLVQQPDGKSIVAALPSYFHFSDESHKYVQLFQSLGFFGLIMVEVRRTLNYNFMIEANPRFWGPSQLFVDAGINLFDAFLHDFGLLDKCPEVHDPDNGVRYFWFGGIFDVLKQNKELTFYRDSHIALFEDLHKWLSFDIYKRKDTIPIFKKELKVS